MCVGNVLLSQFEASHDEWEALLESYLQVWRLCCVSLLTEYSECDRRTASFQGSAHPSFKISRTSRGGKEMTCAMESFAFLLL